MRAHPGVKRDAAAALAMGVDQRRDLAGDAGLRQRLDDDGALPGAIGFHSQCWMAQPPHTEKCGQNGAIRSALARSTAISRRRSG